MKNIFQGNILITKKVAEVLGYEENEEIHYGWFTQDIYFQTFFYLSKRFGQPIIYDDYKDGGTWIFHIKEFNIQIYMNSSWVIFMMFGRIGNSRLNSPYTVKYQRRWRAERENLISLYGKERTPREQQILRDLFEKFKQIHSIDENKISDEEFERKYSNLWFEYVNRYNNDIINIDHKKFTAKYGQVYQNSYTRQALRVLDKFLKNMLTPIWVRDVPYNIKGQMTDKQASIYSKYINNINIEFKA